MMLIVLDGIRFSTLQICFGGDEPYSLTDPLTNNHFLKSRQTFTVTCMPVSMTFNNELPYSNIMDESLSD